MIFLKSDYSNQPMLYIPRVAYGETVGLDYPQAITRDMTAKNPFRPLKTVTFSIETVQPNVCDFLKKFLNETQGYPIQLDFVPHLLRLKGVITEVTFESGRILTVQEVQVEERTIPVWGNGHLPQDDAPDVISRVDHNVNIVMIAPEFINLTEQMVLNDLDEIGLEEDPTGVTGTGGVIWGTG